MTSSASWNAAEGVTTCHVSAGATNFDVDLDVAAGGSGLASPHDVLDSPHDVLDSALASCTTLTLQLFAKRKGLPLTEVTVSVSHADVNGTYTMLREIRVAGELTEEQRASLIRVAEACPVHKTLRGAFAITTDLTERTL